MSQPSKQNPTPANFAVRNTVGKGSKQTPDSDPGHLPADKLREICDKHYNQILPIMAEKVHQEKLQSVQARLSFGESSRRHSQTRGETIFSKLGEKKKDIHARLGPEVAPRHRHASRRRNASVGTPAEDPNKRRKEARSLIRSYITCSSERQREIEREWDEAQTAGDQFIPRELITRKMRMTKGDTGSLGRRNKAKIERWIMPTWCHMFNSTLIGSARVWFDKLPSESIDSYEVLRKAFLGFMHGITNPDLIKRLNDNIPKTVDEMMSVTTAFLRGEAKTAKKEEDSNKEKAAPISMVQPWKRIMKQRVTQTLSPNQEISFPYLASGDRRENPMIIEAKIEGHSIHHMYVDGGSASEILYEYCFNRLRPEIKSRMTPATTPLLGFNGEISWPLGQISLTVSLGDEKHSASTNMNFMVVRSPSPYNGIIGPSGDQKNSSCTIHRLWDVKIFGRRRNSHTPQQHCNSSRLRYGGRRNKRTIPHKSAYGRRDESSHPPWVSGTDNNNMRELVRKRKDGTLQSTKG
ncbi:hypothetical protein Tco_0706206 [Tanacetum coccineum]|uniref:Reverse transcriptase domain-containing protein n=1 Tax=Tanacetum coccineum TaxID=301880 RepID=A0ABQ4Y6V5_9ASTR